MSKCEKCGDKAWYYSNEVKLCRDHFSEYLSIGLQQKLDTANKKIADLEHDNKNLINVSTELESDLKDYKRVHGDFLKETDLRNQNKDLLECIKELLYHRCEYTDKANEANINGLEKIKGEG